MCDNNDPLTHFINVGQLPSECETLTQKRHHVRHHQTKRIFNLLRDVLSEIVHA